MQIGCHGLVFSGEFGETGLRRAVTMAAEAGFDLLEIPLLSPHSFDVAAAKSVLDGAGLGLTASLGLTEATDIASPDGTRSAAGEQLLNRALDVLAELGSGYLVGVIYGPLKKHTEPLSTDARRRTQQVLRRVADRAQDLGIRVGVEVVNRYETNLLNTARQAIEYLDEVDHPNVSVHLDTYHMNIEESDMYRPVQLCGDRLGYVHIGESHRGYLGSGSVDFGSFFRALHDVGYDGPVVFESFSSAVVAEDLSRMLAIWRNLWRDSADLAAHANRFIRDQVLATRSIALQ